MTTSEHDQTPKIDSPLAPEPHSDGKIASSLPEINPKFSPAMLTSQQEKFVHYILSGMPTGAASTAVGIAPATGGTWLTKPHIMQALEYFRAKNRERLSFTIDEAHKLYMDTYRLAEAKEDPMVMKNVVDSLVKLHGVAVAPKPQDVNININSKRQAERIPDEKLLEQAGLSVDYLTPIPKKRATEEPAIEAEYTEVKDN